MRIVNLPANFAKFSIRSKRSQFLAVAAVSATAILLAFSIFVTKRSSAHGVDHAKTKERGCCANQPAILRRMIATYYTTEDNFKSTIILNNKGPNQIVVTPILHSQNGQTFTASPVAIGGQSSSEVDLNTLASVAGPQFRSGSFEFTYEGRLLEVGGGLRITNVEKSLIFDEQMLEPGMKFPSSRLEAVYAVPFENSQVSAIVTNTTAQPIIVNGDAVFAGANGHHPIQSRLGPHETQVINLPHGLVKKASAGAVSLDHDGDKGALLAMIHLWDADRGYSESVNFTDPGGKTNERHGAGLRLGRVNDDQLKAVIAVRNIGESATTVTATVNYSKQSGETGTIALPQVSLAPGAIKLLDTSDPRLRRSDFATAGLEVKYTGAPGSVIATASSVSQSGNQVFALPMKDPQGGLSSTGGYPWFINEKGSTVVFIKNTTKEPQKFHLDIAYPGGSWGSNLRTLAAGQTFALDVRVIRDSQEKGVEGNTIPFDATVGHVSWSVHGVATNKTLIGRAQTVDIKRGMASTYECMICCNSSYSNARVIPLSVSGFPGDAGQFFAQQQDTDCFGNPSGWYDVGGSFSSDNPNVATCDATGFATAVGPGVTNIRASWFAQIVSLEGDPLHCEYFDTTAESSATCDVQPIDFIVINNKPEGIRPTGIIAGLNGADPPIPAGDTQTTITVNTVPARSGKNITLSLVGIQPGFEAGHVGHTGQRPIGTLSQASGTTGSDGKFTVTYTAPIFSGVVRVSATMDGTSKEELITVFIDNLQSLGAGNYYELVGSDGFHPDNHYGIGNALAGLPQIATDYHNVYVSDPAGVGNLRYNDMSLIYGGKFEIAHTWQNTPHDEHRVGRNCDVSVDELYNGIRRRIPQDRWATLTQLYLNNLVQNVLDETNLALPHWHLRFRV